MMKTMNKFLKNTFLVALMATTAVMMSCTEDDPTEPTVTPDTTAPIITLVGNAEIMIGVGDTFTDPGATALDNEDGDISANVVVTGTVDVNLAGSYTLAYNVSDAAGNAATEVTRSVTVSVTVVEDTEAPVITLLGDAEMMLTVGDSFTDPGATALDNKDGDISANITVTGTVDAATVATYTLAYNVSDAAGNAAVEMTRTVIVSESTGDGTEPTAAAPVPTVDASDVISIYSDSYTAVADVNINPDWGQGTQVSEVDIASNMALKYAALNYQGTLYSAQDVSGKGFVHLDLWTADATTINFFVIKEGGSETGVALAVETGKWVSYDIALSEFTGVDLTSVNQFKIDDAGAGNSPTLFIDNFYFYGTGGGGGGGGSEPASGAPVPTVDASDVISLYSDTYTGISGLNTNPDWGQSTQVSEVDLASNMALKYEVLNYQGTVYDAQDVSTKKYVHIDVWTADATTVNFFVIKEGGGETAFSLAIEQGKWVGYDIELSKFSGVDLTSVNQLKIDDAGAGNAPTLWIDNIYFYGTADPVTECPAPPTGELLSNGDFEAGESCWQLFAGTTISTTNNNGGSNSAELQGSPNVAVGLKQERFAAGTLQPNTTYTVSFDIIADGAFGEGGVVKIFTFSEGVDGGNVGATQHVLVDNITSLATSWEAKSYTFTTPGNANQVEGGLSFLIEIVNSSAKLNVDNVVIK